LTNDLINSAFEGGLGALVWLNFHQLLRDKTVKGTHWFPPVFVTIWGYWNLWYYPSLHQWCSFVGGASLALANTAWLALAIHYRKTYGKL